MSDATDARVATIVITTKDRPDFLRTAVESALAQTEQRIEVIVVDDDSVSPPELSFDDERLRVLTNTRSPGVCGARNTGIYAAAGRYLCFLDDDDRLLPEMVAASLDAIEGSSLRSPVAAMGTVQKVAEDGRQVRLQHATSLERGGLYQFDTPRALRRAHVALVAPTEVLRSMGGFDEEFRANEHGDYFLRLGLICSIQGFDEVTYKSLVHPGERNSLRWDRVADAEKRFADKHRAIMTSAQRAQHLRNGADARLRAGRLLSAAKLGAQALWADPAGSTAAASRWMRRRPRRPS